MQQNIPLLVIAGPTASGKTGLSVQLARHFGAEVISADSMQIYQGMAIGTAQPTLEERQGVSHHLMGFLQPGEQFSVADYVALAREKIADIHRRGRLPLLVGGTGLYISSLIDNITFAETGSSQQIREKYQAIAAREGNAHVLGLLRRVDPATADTLHENNIGRVIRALEIYELTGVPMSRHRELSRQSPSPYRLCYLGLDYRERQTLYGRINLRVEQMVAAGLLEEAKALFRSPWSATASQAIGYKELLPYFQGSDTLENCLEQIKMQSRRYAKRQLTWFRRDNRVQWFFPDEWESSAAMLENIIDYIEKSGIMCYTE